MIFFNAYDTTCGRIYNRSEIERDLKKGMILGYSSNPIEGNPHRLTQNKIMTPWVLTNEPHLTSIPLFPHPISFSNVDHVRVIAVDARVYLKSETGEIKLPSEYFFALHRLILEKQMIEQGMDSLNGVFPFASLIYAFRFSQAIFGSYSLDLAEKEHLQVLFQAFFYSLLSPEVKLERMNLDEMVHRISRQSKLRPDDVYRYLEPMNDLTLDGFKSFCDGLSHCVKSVRLENFNLTSMLHLIRSDWFGINAKELIIVATEHLPTWIALIYTTLFYRQYRNTPLYKTMDVLKSSEPAAFMKSYEQIIDDYLPKKSN